MSMQRSVVAVLLLVLVSVAGCGGGKSSQFYRLAPVDTPAEGLLAPRSVVLLEVQVADYLGRPQIITRVGEYEYRLEEFHRWAEPLPRTIEATLRDNLRGRLGTQAVVLSPFVRPSGADYRIAVKVERLDVDQGGHCVLEASWVFVTGSATARDLAAGVERRSFETDVEGKVEKDDLSPQVAAMSRLIGELSDAITASARAYLQTP